MHSASGAQGSDRERGCQHASDVKEANRTRGCLPALRLAACASSVRDIARNIVLSETEAICASGNRMTMQVTTQQKPPAMVVVQAVAGSSPVAHP
jgi:hypothetical protein